MAQNLMVWLLEPRVVLEEHTGHLRKQLADTEAEVARLEAAEVVYWQYQEDADAGHPDAEAWQQALKEATGGAPAVPAPGTGATPGAAGQLLIPHRSQDSGPEDLPADYQAIMGIVAGGDGPLQAKDVARELGLDPVPAKVEPVRGKLRKLAERGWITRTPAGRYLPRQGATGPEQRPILAATRMPPTGFGQLVKTKTSPAGDTVSLVYSVRLPLSSQTVNYVAGLIRAHRKTIRSRWRKLDAGRIAVIALAHLRDDERLADLAGGNAVSASTVRRWVLEAIDLLAAHSPRLDRALAKVAKDSGCVVLLDGTLIRTRRRTGRANRKNYSGKHKAHGLLFLALTDAKGRLLWISSARRGACSEITAARYEKLCARLREFQLGAVADLGFVGLDDGGCACAARTHAAHRARTPPPTPSTRPR